MTTHRRQLYSDGAQLRRVWHVSRSIRERARAGATIDLDTPATTAPAPAPDPFALAPRVVLPYRLRTSLARRARCECGLEMRAERDEARRSYVVWHGHVQRRFGDDDAITLAEANGFAVTRSGNLIPSDVERLRRALTDTLDRLVTEWVATLHGSVQRCWSGQWSPHDQAMRDWRAEQFLLEGEWAGDDAPQFHRDLDAAPSDLRDYVLPRRCNCRDCLTARSAQFRTMASRIDWTHPTYRAAFIAVQRDVRAALETPGTLDYMSSEGTRDGLLNYIDPDSANGCNCAYCLSSRRQSEAQHREARAADAARNRVWDEIRDERWAEFAESVAATEPAPNFADETSWQQHRIAVMGSDDGTLVECAERLWHEARARRRRAEDAGDREA